MKARGTVILVAFLLATTATGAVFLYLRGVKEEAQTGGDRVSVIVSKRDIAAGSELDVLIAEGAFAPMQVPESTMVDGAVTALSQLEGRRATVPILAGEQIPTARLQGSTELPGGTLGIPEGHEAVTVQLEVPRIAGGAIQQGDHVTIYATFQDVRVIPGSLENILQGKAFPTGPGTEIGDFTVSLVPDVLVLKVLPGPAAQTGPEGDPEQLMLTMALRPRDGQKLVFAQEVGTVWLALLPPDEKGTSEPPVSVGELLQR
jgi:pilus assembly protein CpaB